MHMMLLKCPRGGLHMVSVFCFPGLSGSPKRLPASFLAVAIDLGNKNT